MLGALTHLPTQVPIAQVRALSGRQCSAENDRSAKGAGSATRCILYILLFLSRQDVFLLLWQNVTGAFFNASRLHIGREG